LKALEPDSTGLPRVLGIGGYRSAPAGCCPSWLAKS
jgi:hypothetical protein